MKKIAIICLVLILLFCTMPVSVLASEDLSVTTGCHSLDGQVPFLGTAQLVSNTNAALLYETNTDTLLYAYNADAQVQPSSLLKIMTALIAIEKGSMTDVVTVREEVLDTLPPDAAVAGLQVDEVLTVKDLLYCMMVVSGNDAAVVLADHVLGDQQAFVEEMNRYAVELGCTGTNFTNVHGIHNNNQFTTARDVARILKKAMENELFREVFSAKNYDMPATNKSEARRLVTQNYLINNDKIAYYDPRVIGGRTAVNNDRSRSIATFAQQDDMDVICVVIGAKSQFEKDGYTEKVHGGYDETKQFFDLAFNGNRTAQILYPNQVVAQKTVLNGNCDVTVGARDGAFSVIAENLDPNALSYRFMNEIPLTAPIEIGQKLADLQVWYGSVCLIQTDAYAMNSVPIAGTAFEDNKDHKKDIGAMGTVLLVIGGIIVVGLGAFATLYVLRVFRIAKVKRQSRRNSRNRRRSR